MYDALTSSDLIDTNGLISVELAIPSDLVKFIHLRTIGDRGRLWNEKTDVRTYHDMFADRYSENYWARQGNNLLIAGHIQAGDVFELFYYRRLPAANATYTVTPANFVLGALTQVDEDGTELFFPAGTTDPDTVTDASDIATAQNAGETLVPFQFDGDEIPHWLRDENRKILLFGALAYCGKYLMDDMLVQYHAQQYAAEIEAVNNEEKMRKASGGNVQMHFNGRGLI